MERRQVGWVTTLLALVVLVVVGFLLGALAGFLWEEPGLVWAYLTGDTEPVEWTEAAPVAAEPPLFAGGADESAAEIRPESEPDSEPAADAATARPAPVAAAVAPPAPAAEPAAKPGAPRVASAPTGRFAVQVGAFADSAAAEKLAARLRERGYDSYVKTDEAGAARFRVRVGPVGERAQAESLAAKLRKGEKLPTWILDEGAG